MIVVGGLWFLGVFFTFIGGMPKVFQNAPASTIDASHVRSQQKTTVQDTEEKRRQMMEDMKQKISDGNRKY